MTAVDRDEQRSRALAHLERRETIATQTREAIDGRERDVGRVSLEGVDESVFEEVEAEFYRQRGRERYVSHDGRTLWLTPEEREHRLEIRRKRRQSYSYYPKFVDRRRVLNLTFNILAVLLALAVVYIFIF